MSLELGQIGDIFALHDPEAFAGRRGKNPS
jgi:hypothetical protein